MSQVEDHGAQKALETELRELERQRLKVEQRLKELEAKERSALGGRPGRAPLRGVNNKRPRDDFYEARGRPEMRDPRSRSDNFPNKRRMPFATGSNSMDIDHRAPKITSAVVKVNADRTTEKPTPSLDVNNEEVKKRNKKMFGVLLGTLQQFKKDIEQHTEVDQKRHEIDAMVQSKVEHERDELMEQHKKIIHEQKERELALAEELRRKQEATELALLESKWSRNRSLLSSPLFHKTRQSPPVYFAFNPSAPPIDIPSLVLADSLAQHRSLPSKSEQGVTGTDVDMDKDKGRRASRSRSRSREGSVSSDSGSESESGEDSGTRGDDETEPNANTNTNTNTSPPTADREGGGSDKEHDG